MTEVQHSRIVRQASNAFREVFAGDVAAVAELLTLFEAQPIPAADAVLMLAELEIRRRRLMAGVDECATMLRASAAPLALDVAEACR